MGSLPMSLKNSTRERLASVTEARRSPRPRPRRKRVSVLQVIVAGLLTVGGLASVLPFLLMLSFSFGSSAELGRLPPPIIPSALRLDNYIAVFERVPMTQFLINSLVVAILVVIGQLIVCSMAAYAFARLEFRGRAALFSVYLVSLMVPSQLTIVPLFLVMRQLDLVDSLAALILPSLMSVFGIFLLRQAFAAIPKELEDAAKMDGAGHFSIYRRIVMPMSGPALVALAILAFNAVWNSFLWPLIIINSPENMTLPVGVTFLQGQEYTSTGILTAAATVSVLAPLLVFIVLQRRLVEGVAMSSGR